MLNPALNATALATAYGHKRRVLIRDVLTPEVAARLAHCLREEVPWGLAIMVRGENRNLAPSDVPDIRSPEWQALLARVHQEARSGYQFLHNNYQMVAAYKNRSHPNLFLHRFLEFINSAPVLDLVRRVTAHDDIVKADAQATRYLPGHFLRRHNDVNSRDSQDNRRAAYVFNMTRGWQADWGGLLQFLDDDGNVEETWVPRYNALALFSVPAWHCVSCVAPFATEPRLAVTGWFRTH